MKQLRLMSILLFLGAVLFSNAATAELTAYQQVPPSAKVGEMVLVNVMLTYNGADPTAAAITPLLPFGVVSNAGTQVAQLMPGARQLISYPFYAEQSGNYMIVSEISWDESGSMRNLRLEDPFSAVGEPEIPKNPQQPPYQSEPQPAEEPETDNPLPDEGRDLSSTNTNSTATN